MNAAEYLARVGYGHLLARLGGPTVPEWADEDDQDALDAAAEAARVLDHKRVRDLLADSGNKPAERSPALNGAKWLGMVLSWPDRVPGLKPWAGHSSLPQIITQRRAALMRWDGADGPLDLFRWTTFPEPKGAAAKKRLKEAAKSLPEYPFTHEDFAAIQAAIEGVAPEDLREGEGHSGIDAYPCVNALDAGFSPHAAEIRVAYRPALELLAIVGMETVPLVSFAPRVCGFVHDGRVWQFAVEDRDGDRKKWGELREHSSALVPA